MWQNLKNKYLTAIKYYRGTQWFTQKLGQQPHETVSMTVTNFETMFKLRGHPSYFGKAVQEVYSRDPNRFLFRISIRIETAFYSGFSTERLFPFRLNTWKHLLDSLVRNKKDTPVLVTVLALPSGTGIFILSIISLKCTKK